MVRDWTLYNCEPTEDIISLLMLRNLDHVICSIFRENQQNIWLLECVFATKIKTDDKSENWALWFSYESYLDSFTIKVTARVSPSWKEFVGEYKFTQQNCVWTSNLHQLFQISITAAAHGLRLAGVTGVEHQWSHTPEWNVGTLFSPCAF